MYLQRLTTSYIAQAPESFPPLTLAGPSAGPPRLTSAAAHPPPHMPARPLKILLLSSAVALGISAQAQAATTAPSSRSSTATPSRCARRPRRAPSTCSASRSPPATPRPHARSSRKLLPAKARVKLVKDGAQKGRYVHRGSTFVNAALLRSGAAQGKDLPDAQARRAR